MAYECIYSYVSSDYIDSFLVTHTPGRIAAAVFIGVIYKFLLCINSNIGMKALPNGVALASGLMTLKLSAYVCVALLSSVTTVYDSVFKLSSNSPL